MAWLIALIVIVVVLAVAAFVAMRARGSSRLRRQFGPEYERRVVEQGDRRSAEAELREVSRQRRQLDVRPLSDEARAHYTERWRTVQADFVDQPDRAVDEADVLVAEVMHDRGYPVEDFEARVDMVAVDHPAMVEHYRAAHAIAVRNGERMADTDDLRQALLHYRELFDELLDQRASAR